MILWPALAIYASEMGTLCWGGFHFQVQVGREPDDDLHLPCPLPQLSYRGRGVK